MKPLMELSTSDVLAAVANVEKGLHTIEDLNLLRAFCDRLTVLEYEARYWREQCRIMTMAENEREAAIHDGVSLHSNSRYVSGTALYCGNDKFWREIG